MVQIARISEIVYVWSVCIGFNMFCNSFYTVLQYLLYIL